MEPPVFFFYFLSTDAGKEGEVGSLRMDGGAY
jgi:hypothetical protein